MPFIRPESAWYVYRGNARPEVETSFFELNAAPAEPTLDVLFSAPDIPNNSIFGYRSATDDNFRWRFDLDEQDSTVTIVTRIRSIDADASGMMHLDIRAFGWRQKVRLNSTTIKFERSSPIIEETLPFDWNDGYHIIRLVVTGQTTTVYLDEDTTPFMSGPSNDPRDQGYFEWGKSGGEDYGAFVDWMAVNITEASAPGAGPALPEDLFLSSDATLATLSVNGVEIDTFAPYQTDYLVEVAGGIIPSVEWTTTSDLASATGMQPDIPSDTTLITVAAQDGFTTRTYRLITVGLTSTFSPLLQSAVSVFPNPAQGYVNVALELPGTYSMQLFSMNGRAVSGVKKISGYGGIDVSSLPQGLYVMLVRSEPGQAARFKIIVE